VEDFCCGPGSIANFQQTSSSWRQKMAIAEQNSFEIAPNDRNYDFSIQVGYAAFAIVLLIAIYFGSMSSGTAPGDFAMMTVFP
jgi:hypothetical protein